VAANAKDMVYGQDKGLSPAMLDRLMLDDARIDGIVAGLRAVADQAIRWAGSSRNGTCRRASTSAASARRSASSA
jgi:hypothetical protein